MIQYFFENLWLAWLLVGLLCLVLELTNGDFFIICFAIGGVVAAIVSTFSERNGGSAPRTLCLHKRYRPTRTGLRFRPSECYHERQYSDANQCATLFPDYGPIQGCVRNKQPTKCYRKADTNYAS